MVFCKYHASVAHFAHGMVFRWHSVSCTFSEYAFHLVLYIHSCIHRCTYHVATIHTEYLSYLHCHCHIYIYFLPHYSYSYYQFYLKKKKKKFILFSLINKNAVLELLKPLKDYFHLKFLPVSRNPFYFAFNQIRGCTHIKYLLSITMGKIKYVEILYVALHMSGNGSKHT